MIKVNIYYGGRGLIEDPTIYVMNKLTEVFKELNVEVYRYNLYEDKRSISVLPKTLKEADAIILAASVEWFGIGGLLQQFLDACWLYGDKEAIKQLYMMPVVLSTTYGEQDSMLQLRKAWDLLGGRPYEGICAYVENQVDFETNPDYLAYIEKKAENFYRAFNKKLCVLPSSDNAVSDTMSHSASIDLTPQESEQLSMYVSDETYVKKQKKDIQELSAMFRKELGDVAEPVHNDPYIASLHEHFKAIPGLAVTYLLDITDLKKQLLVTIDDQNLSCTYQIPEPCEPDVLIRLTHTQVNEIFSGNMTMQKAFMSGSLSEKGDFKIFRNFDLLFRF